MLKQQSTGLTKAGFYGFSWTTLFFGPWPALFRGDFALFFVYFGLVVVVAIFTYGLGIWVLGIVWAFIYNRNYTRRLIERGYSFNDSPGIMAEAAAKLGVDIPVAQGVSDVTARIQ